MHNFVRAHWHDVFLDEHLDAVCHRLKKPEWPNAIWSVAILHAPENFPFEHGNECKEREKDAEQRENINEARCELDHPVRRTREQRKEHLLCADENLVKKIVHLR